MDKVVELSSGAKLTVKLAPFADSRTLYQAILEEAKDIRLNPNDEVDVNFFKDGFCAFLSSKKVEAALDKCMQRCLVNELKIDKDTFESEERREDYFTVVTEVAMHNIAPFTKSLYAKLSPIVEKLKKLPV